MASKGGSRSTMESKGGSRSNMESSVSSIDIHADDYLDSITGFTNKEKSSLKASWRKVLGETEQDYKDFAMTLTFWMQEIYEDALRMFPESVRASQKEVNDRFMAHANLTIEGINEFVCLLMSPEMLIQEMHDVARKHFALKPVINREYFSVFAQKYHLLMERHLELGPAHNEVILWSRLMELLSKNVDEAWKLKRRELGLSDSQILIYDPKRKKGCCCSVL